MPPSPPTVTSPLRILVLAPADSLPLPLFKDIETYEIQTPYYSASLPIWQDTLPLSSTALSNWRNEWSSPEAHEVVDAIGAWILCLPHPSDHRSLDDLKAAMRTVKDVIDLHNGAEQDYAENEPLLLAVIRRGGMVSGNGGGLGAEEWEDLCGELGGWEWVDGGKNDFGEKIGMERVKEALESCEWEGGHGGVEGEEDFVDEVEERLALEGEAGELKGLRESLLEHGAGEKGGEGVEEVSGGDEDVQALESMLLKMQAIRDMGAHMPEAERRKFAAKAVRDVMRTV
ncbi:uncharacterized protein KY384_004841 [Bacidia gigantensis]|uniref:uncharacterized protein n=1 Tax=Bacidia gigantensis TaxID=2732470 RepID=UPI001D0542C9|nr:uncharacterized protein KY384_004841 [Bacidia gigantensis]KAG8530339.1 hypothetical protein KY384_004841 [Bacidia gigantensis]